MTARIRPARPSDLRHLAAIEDAGVALFEDHLGADLVPALVSPAPSGAARDAEPGFLLVAVDEGRVVGFVHVLHVPEAVGWAHLEQVSVQPDHLRRGVGSALVRAAMEEARLEGHDRMSLCTYRDLPWNGPFYRRLGFEPTARPEPFQVALRRHEQELRLDEHGPREVLVTRLSRQVTGE